MATDLHHYSNIWHSGFPLISLQANRKPSHPLTRVPGCIQTTNALGNLAGHAITEAHQLGPRVWQFEAGLPPGFDVTEIQLLNTGYRIETRQGSEMIFIQVHPGVFCGVAPLTVVPELFSNTHAIETEGSVSWMETPEMRIWLEHRQVDDQRQIALVVSPEKKDREGMRMTARKMLEEVSPKQMWTGLWKERMAWLSRLNAEERPVLFDLALETVEAALMPAAGPFAAQWIRDPALSGAGMNLNHLQGELPAIRAISPDALDGVLKTLTGLTPNPQGFLPSTVLLSGDASPYPAWPTLCQALAPYPEAVSRAGAPLIENLAGHLTAFLDSKREGDPLPVWPVGDGAFTPEIFDESLSLVDLPSLLVAEMEAFAKLSGDNGRFASAHDALRTAVLKLCWQPQRGVFLDRVYEDASPVKRMTAGGLLPFLWADLPDAQARGLYRYLETSAESLRGSHGLLQWEPRKGDPAAPPSTSTLQHLLLHPLLKKSPPEVSTLMGAAWGSVLDALSRNDAGLPLDFQAGAAPIWHPLTAAFCVRFAPLHTRLDLELSHYPKFVRFLERHRKGIVGLAAMLVLILPGTFGLYYAMRPDFSAAREQDEAGHAETLYRLGQYQEAAEIYTGLLNLGRFHARHGYYYHQRGKCHWHLGDFPAARNDFARAVERDTDFMMPSAHWNLAQALWRLGETDAARAQFEDVLEVFSEGYPEFGPLARDALQMLDTTNFTPGISSL